MAAAGASGHGRAYLLAFGSAAAAGSGAVAGKIGVTGAPVATFLTWLFGFAVVFASAWLLLAPPPRGLRITRRGIALVAAHAALAGLGCWGWYTGLAALDAAVASFLSRTEVLITIALGIALLGERLTRLEIAGGTIAILGLVLMRLPLGKPLGPEHAAGISWVLLGSLGFGASEIPAKLAMRETDPTTFALARSVPLALGWLVVALLTGTAYMPAWPVVASAAGVGLLGPVVARVFYLSALRVLALARVSLVVQTMPLFTALVGFVALGTAPQPHEWAGGLLLIAGTLLVVRGARPRALPPDPPAP
jgi:drug/metabolite transporter (DMT)-like permease